MPHSERHRTHRIEWLRAAALGTNDGLESTASLVLRVVIAGASSTITVIPGITGFVAGALSMASGKSVMTAAARVTFGEALAMALTAGVGALFGVAP